MGRIAPDYYVQDGVIPRTRLPEVLRRIDELSAEYGLRVATCSTPATATCTRWSATTRRRRARRSGPRSWPGRSSTLRRRGRLDHRRARRRAWTRRRYMPTMFAEADLDAFQRLRCAFDPARPGQPGQGDADAAAVRRGAGPVPRASARASRRGGAVLMATARAAHGHPRRSRRPRRARGGRAPMGSRPRRAAAGPSSAGGRRPPSPTSSCRRPPASTGRWSTTSAT